MAKRGRKPNPDKYASGYFYEREEDAIVTYVNTDDAYEKNLIFEEILRPAFKKMIESIIRVYNLYIDGESFEVTYNDAMSHIIDKLGKFEKGRAKAYSYFQTICKNHLLGKINDRQKCLARNVSYEDIYDDLRENEDYSYVMPDRESELTGLISETTNKIKHEISSETSVLSRNDKIVGKCLAYVLDNWYELFDDFDNGDSKKSSRKFDKSVIMMYIKENTNLPIKDIRTAIRKYKVLYFKTKSDFL